MQIINRRGSSKEGHYTIAAVLAAVAVVATLATTAVSIYQQQQQAAYESKVAKFNEKVKQNDAVMAQDAAAIQAQRIRAQGERDTATGTAILSAGGLDVTQGSALLYQVDQASQIDYAARLQIYSGQVKAAGDIAGAEEYASQASDIMAQSQGNTLLTGIGGVGSAAGIAAKAYGQSPSSSGGAV